VTYDNEIRLFVSNLDFDLIYVKLPGESKILIT